MPTWGNDGGVNSGAVYTTDQPIIDAMDELAAWFNNRLPYGHQPVWIRNTIMKHSDDAQSNTEDNNVEDMDEENLDKFPQRLRCNKIYYRLVVAPDPNFNDQGLISWYPVQAALRTLGFYRNKDIGIPPAYTTTQEDLAAVLAVLIDTDENVDSTNMHLRFFQQNWNHYNIIKTAESAFQALGMRTHIYTGAKGPLQGAQTFRDGQALHTNWTLRAWGPTSALLQPYIKLHRKQNFDHTYLTTTMMSVLEKNQRLLNTPAPLVHIQVGGGHFQRPLYHILHVGTEHRAAPSIASAVIEQ